MTEHRLLSRVAPAALAMLLILGPSVGARADSASMSSAIPTASGPVHVVPVGGALPSDAECADRVVPTAENRPENIPFNNTRGSSPNDENPLVTGNFVGTTDEIIQWASCKWGMDPTWARNQAALESFWIHTTIADFATDPAVCLPGHPIGVDGRPGECPEATGLLQIRIQYHPTAFEDDNAIRSTAYNADYAWSIWRRCFEGEYTWLNEVERGEGATYAAGDGLGCMGVWFSGRWYTEAAVGYMDRLPTAGSGIPMPAPAPVSTAG